jgi:hypothetical protein
MKLSDILYTGGGDPVQHLANPVNVASAGIGVGAWLGHLPNIAAGVTVIWLSVNIFFLLKDRFTKKKDDKK